MTYKVLSLSDKENEVIYSPGLKERFADVDFIFGCGDLTYAYQEYVVSMLDVPLYYVRGNHSRMIEHTSSGPKTRPHGGTDIHRRVVNTHGLIIAGVEGSLRYRRGPFQYSQFEMWKHVFGILPSP